MNADVIRVLDIKSNFNGDRIRIGMFGFATDTSELVARVNDGTYRFIKGFPSSHQHSISDVVDLAAELDKINNSLDIEIQANMAVLANESTVKLSIDYTNLKTGVTSTYLYPLPVINEDISGVMNPETYQALQKAIVDIAGLQGAGYVFASLGQSPSQSDLTNAWISSKGSQPIDGSHIVNLDENNRRYTFGADVGGVQQWFVEPNFELAIATQSVLGGIYSSIADGTGYVNYNGVLSVNGWDSIKSRVSTLESTAQSLQSQINNKVDRSELPIGADISTPALTQTVTQGTSPNFARADHRHAIPAIPTEANVLAIMGTKWLDQATVVLGSWNLAFRFRPNGTNRSVRIMLEHSLSSQVRPTFDITISSDNRATSATNNNYCAYSGSRADDFVRLVYNGGVANGTIDIWLWHGGGNVRAVSLRVVGHSNDIESISNVSQVSAPITNIPYRDDRQNKVDWDASPGLSDIANNYEFPFVPLLKSNAATVIFMGTWWVRDAESTTAFLECANGIALVLPLMRPIANSTGYKDLVKHPVNATNRPALLRINGNAVGSTPTTGGAGWTRIPLRRWDCLFATFDTNNESPGSGVTLYVDSYQNTSLFLQTRRGIILAVRHGNDFNDASVQLANGMIIGINGWYLDRGALTLSFDDSRVSYNPWLAMSPHLWPVNQEIAFPDGSFGVRKTGSPSGSNNFFEIDHPRTTNINIISAGGWYSRGGTGSAGKRAWGTNAFGEEAILFLSNNNIRWQFQFPTSGTGFAYDLWCIYTK